MRKLLTEMLPLMIGLTLSSTWGGTVDLSHENLTSIHYPTCKEFYFDIPLWLRTSLSPISRRNVDATNDYMFLSYPTFHTCLI
jgi:hypothetical protein